MKISYPVKGAVSVWVGTFEDEEEFDSAVKEYVEIRIGRDLWRFSEGTFDRSAGTIQTLITGFSQWRSYEPQVTQAAVRSGITSANAALVCFNVECSDSPPPVWGKLYFLGTFRCLSS